MDVDKLEAGRELDALIAEKVMGWQTEPNPDGSLSVFNQAVEYIYLIGCEEGYPDCAPPWWPSTDIAAAWEARTKVVDSTGAVMELMDYGGPKDDFERYACTFLKERPNSGGLEWGASGWANTVTLAICRAVLKPVKD